MGVRNGTLEAIDTSELDNLIGKIELIDVREHYEYRKSSIQTSKNIPMRQLLAEPEKYLDKNKKYYIICQTGVRSYRVVSELVTQGYQVVNVLGGVGGYNGKYKVDNN